MAKERLDVLLVNRRLADSREKAKAAVKGGHVFVDGVCETKPGAMLEDSVQIELKGVAMKYVSRGGYKLEKAVVSHDIGLTGLVCMDVGASTGGFTDCMLQNGAARVYAVDVGTGQLAEKLRNDDRVISMEQTNIRYVTLEDIGEKIDFVSIDVAFISLTKVLEPVRALMADNGSVCCLIKPQFEAGRENIGKNGVVRDARIHEQVIGNVLSYALSLGFRLRSLDWSPIKGPEGNIEYLAVLGLVSGDTEISDTLIADTVKDAHSKL